jgi:hypothetical protein
MDELLRLLSGATTGATNGGETRSLGSMLERGLVYGLIFGALAFACGCAVVGFLAFAVYAAALPGYGEVKAACLAALAATVVMGILVYGLRRVFQPAAAPPPVERASPLTAAAQSSAPRTIWDLVTLVAAGVLAGMAQKR